MITNRLTNKKIQLDPHLYNEINTITGKINSHYQTISNKKLKLAEKLNGCSSAEEIERYNQAAIDLEENSKEAIEIKRLQLLGRIKIEELQNRFFSEYSNKKQVIESCNEFVNELEKADFDKYLEKARKQLKALTDKLTKEQAERLESYAFISEDTQKDCYKYFTNIDDYYLLESLCKNKGVKTSVLSDLLLNKVSSFYPGEQPLTKAVLNMFSEDTASIKLKPQQETENYLFIPTSPIVKGLFDTINNASDLNRYAERGLITSKGAITEIKENKKNPNRKLLKTTKGNETIEIDIGDITQLASSSKTAKKLFLFILMKMNQQAFTNGYLYKNSIEFPAQELIDMGFCTTIKGAKKSFISGAKSLMGIQVSGKTTIGNNEIVQANGAVLFTAYDIPKYSNTCIIDFNDRINWNFILSYFTPLQKYGFSLNSKAFDLLFNINYLARQNKRKISETGEFNISMRTIQRVLNLPDETKVKDPRGKIINEIERAIEEIEEKNKNPEFTITPMYDINGSVREILSGYLKIGITGKSAEPYIKLADTQSKKIETAAKRKEKVKTEAEAKVLAEEMKKKKKAEAEN